MHLKTDAYDSWKAQKTYHTCTSFKFDDSNIVFCVKNMDWNLYSGLFIIRNKENMTCEF